ncbi:hypothetical protein AcW1_001163 [Taiwanofungus camphoratus]|nr:hypothetical protein AcW1_001163 [Antrodia cinnamomea]
MPGEPITLLGTHTEGDIWGGLCNYLRGHPPKQGSRPTIVLSMLPRAAARALPVSHSDLQTEECPGTEGEDSDVFYVDMELRDFINQLPEVSWARVAEVCTRSITPMYWVIHNTLRDDIEHLARVMAELDYPSEKDAPAKTVQQAVSPLPGGCRLNRSISLTRAPRRKRRSSAVNQEAQLIIPGSGPSIPTIVVTPCPSQPRNTTCMVPFQNALFGSRLTVPTHPVLNGAFPPLISDPFPIAEHWQYENGHWHALLPDAEEQMTKGMFSRPVPSRRKRACVQADCHSCPNRSRPLRPSQCGGNVHRTG